MARTTTATKPVAQAAQIAAAKPIDRKEQPHAAQVDGDEFDPQDFRAFVTDMWANLGLPSGKRMLASLVLGLAASLGVGYIIGKVVAATMLGMFAMTSSLFLFWLVAALGLVLGGWLAAKAGTAVAKWIASGRADEQVIDAKNRVTGWFSRKPVVAAA